MAKILSVASQKGGVGKTTTALNVSYLLSLMGEKVLLVDGDPQGGVAISSNLTRKTTLGIIDVLSGRARPADIIAPVKGASLSIMGGGVMEPDSVTAYESAARDGQVGELIRSVADGFDYVVLDAPAGVGEVVRELMLASDSVILTLRPRNLSVKSIPPFLKLVKWIKQRSPRPFAIEGVVVTMFDDESGFEADTLTRIKKIIPEELFFKSVIPFSESFEKASIRALPIALLPEAKRASQAYKELALEIKARESFRIAPKVEDENGEGLF